MGQNTTMPSKKASVLPEIKYPFVYIRIASCTRPCTVADVVSFIGTVIVFSFVLGNEPALPTIKYSFVAIRINSCLFVVKCAFLTK